MTVYQIQTESNLERNRMIHIGPCTFGSHISLSVNNRQTPKKLKEKVRNKQYPAENPHRDHATQRSAFMKKFMAVTLSLLLLLALCSCSAKEDVEFYGTKTYIKQSTGDINLLENTYDENWNLLQSYITLNGNFSSKTEYAYNEDFTVLTTKTTFASNEPDTSKIIRTFDDRGQVIKAETYDGDRHISTAEYTYDDNGEMTFVRSTQPENDIVTTVQRIFDEKGNLVTYIQDTGFYVGRYEYAYNQKNQRIREEYFRDDVQLEYIEFTWEGNIGTGTSYKTDGTPMGKHLLEYDDYGNLLRLESQDRLGAARTVTCMEYIGTDGTVSSGIPE